MRVVILAQDDSASTCLTPLAAQKCEVLAIGCGGEQCAMFARRCVDLGFGFLSLGEGTKEITASLVSSFQADLMVFVPDVNDEAPAIFAAGEAKRKCSLRTARVYELSGAPWPEFAPIWLGHDSVSVEVAQGDEVVASSSIRLSTDETANTLRMKTSEVKADLLEALVAGRDLPAPQRRGEGGASVAAAPASISLDWDEETVERFVRARLFLPRDPAEVAEPVSGEVYFIESMEQYREFRTRVLKEGVRESGSQAAYAADTHWYSNVNGSIMKMGDSNVHVPAKAAERKRPVVIPGAALSARKKLRMNEPLIGPNAERYCARALESTWLGVEGPYVKQLERQLAMITGCRASCAVQSGTAACYGAMKALGVADPSHHVLVPSFTCAACADAVVHAGGLPIPIDCELDSYAVSVEAVRKALDTNKNIVGVVIAPCYGVPSRDYYEIYLLCKERGLWLCEDACETYGAVHCVPGPDGVLTKMPVGSLSTLCVVSVRSEKMIGVGEGGAILGNDTTLVARAKWWCSRAPSRGVGLWRVYEHDAVGQNFRLPEMLAAVGCASAEMLPAMKERKRAIHAWYEAEFASRPELKGVRLQKCAPGDEPVWWINAALLPEGVSGEKVGMRLMKEFPDIEIRPGFFPLNTMDIFKSAWVGSCPNAEKLYLSLVCLPSSNLLAKADVERVCMALAHALHAVTSEGSSS